MSCNTCHPVNSARTALKYSHHPCLANSGTEWQYGAAALFTHF
jgi:hypothetical protein